MALLEDSLIAHYKMNENTAGDNAELVINGDFAAWTADNPDGWAVDGEAGADPEISEVGTGEGHGGVGTGMCNLYSSDGTNIAIYQDKVFVLGRKYRINITIDTVTAGAIRFLDAGVGPVFSVVFTTTGTKTITFVATKTNIRVRIQRAVIELTDVTFDDVSIKLLAIEDSSGNDHDALAQQDSDAISVPGKINTALEFNGTTDYITVPDHDDFTPALTPFSISAWVNMVDASEFALVGKGAYNIDGEWRFFVELDDTVNFILFDESVDNCFIGRAYNIALTSYENQWIHLVVTYDGGTVSSGVRLYLNGIRVDNANKESNAGSFVAVENLNADILIGKYTLSLADGLVDNVMLFNKELTALEVQLLYNSGAGVETIPTGIHLSRTGQQFSSSPMN